MLSETTAYHQSLSGSLALKSVANLKDVERVAAFNAAVHGTGVGPMTHHLIVDHPDTQPHHWLYVEDESNDEVVAALCLIPWTWRFEGITLRAGEVGIVGTDPAYRKRGLIRAMMARHKEMLADEHFDLSQIQGIPYFYRQFGYEYALPLEIHWNLELRQISEPAQPLSWRPANEDDIPTLQRLYEQAMSELDLSAVRTEDHWRYLLGPSMLTEMIADCSVMLDESGQIQGYWRIAHAGFGTGLIVFEVSHLEPELALALLQHLKGVAIERSKPYIRLNLPENSVLLRVARDLGAHLEGDYAWQIHLPDPGALLQKIAPVLERRLAGSAYAGLTRSLALDVYRTGWTLRFENGRLKAVEPLETEAESDLRLPPQLLPQLLLGYRTMTELETAYHDAQTNSEVRDLVGILFPRTTAFFYTIY